MGFPTKNDHFGVWNGGYHHLRNHPNIHGNCGMEPKSDFRRPWKFRIYTKVGDLKTYRLGPQQPMKSMKVFFQPPKRGVKKKHLEIEGGRFPCGFNQPGQKGGCLAMGLGANWRLKMFQNVRDWCDGKWPNLWMDGMVASGIHPVMKGLHSISRWWQEFPEFCQKKIVALTKVLLFLLFKSKVL